MSDLHEPPPPTDLTQIPIREAEEHDDAGMRGGSSAKIDQLVHLLRLMPPNEKSLVFSQFTSFLDKVRHLSLLMTLTNIVQISETFEKEGFAQWSDISLN